jgi:hypothetical protein
MADPTPPADSTATPPPEPPPAAPDDGLGEAGQKAIAAERTARKAAEKAAKTAQDELDKLRTATMSETEKAIAEAKAEGRKTALSEVNGKLLRSEIRAAAAGKLADPDDAPLLLGDLDQFLDKDGDPIPKAIASAIDTLVKSKPYLASAGSRPGPLPGGGAKPSNGFSMNDEIRRMAGRQ